MLVYKHVFDDVDIYLFCYLDRTLKGSPVVHRKMICKHFHIALSCRLCYREARVLFYRSAIWCFRMIKEVLERPGDYTFPPFRFTDLVLSTDPYDNMGKHLRDLALKELPALEIVELCVLYMAKCTDRSVSKCGSSEILELLCQKLNRGEPGIHAILMAYSQVKVYVRITIHYKSEAPFQRILTDLHSKQIFRAIPFAKRDWDKKDGEEERDAQLPVLTNSTSKKRPPILNRFGCFDKI
jgi:hypothetical protein